ncbi:MAG: prenyltransferase [Bacteroidetes bacterium B1(2017)]|nr:MAG: prenyltransferase [Bacteroidetes bacterium B1(2017)]
MNKVLDFIRLIRLNNLLIIVATQIFAYYFLTPSISYKTLLQPSFFALLISTFLAAAAGYIINDYMDVMLDLVNKPEKVIVGKSISRRYSMFLHFILNTLSIGLAFSISKSMAVLVLACVLSLWLYSQFLKKTYLSGNIMVAFLTAFTLWILFVYDPNVFKAGIWVYGIFAFITTLQREIIKDTEDLRGDSKFKCRTLPIVLGIRKTKEVLFWLQITLLILSISFCFSFESLSFSSTNTNKWFLIYMLIAVIIPMLILAWRIKKADVKNDFSQLSFLSKVIMVTGIISMVFWRF